MPTATFESAPDEFAIRKTAFFDAMAKQFLALTFEDVILDTRSGSSEPMPPVLDLSSKFSRHIGLKMPFVSAAMSSVTEAPMAIAMAKSGGLGVIHAGLPVDELRQQLRRVKLAANTMVDKPITVHETDSLQNVLDMRHRMMLPFMTFPVVNGAGKFAGLLCRRHFKYATDPAGTLVGDKMIPAESVVTAQPGTGYQKAYREMQGHEVSSMPVVSRANILKGLYVWSDVQRVMLESSRYNTDIHGQLIVAAAISTRGDYVDRITEIEKYVDALVLDTADGDSYYVFDAIKRIKARFPDKDVVAGNVTAGDSAVELAQAGADGIKVGQGGGSICSTRDETGIGKPQLSAVYECARALQANFSDVPVCSDGGIVKNGDPSKAIAGGASTVMMGRRFGGTDETPGEVFTLPDGSQYKYYWGMGSRKAFRQSQASIDRYIGQEGKMPIPEGVEARVPYQGAVRDVLKICIAALDKSMRYTKSRSIQDHRLKTTFSRMTEAGKTESSPHDVEEIS